MTTFTVVGSVQKKSLPDAQNGPAQVIALNLQDDQGKALTAEWFTKAATPLPSPASKIEGTVEESQYGLKFKKAAGAFGGGGRQMSPEDRKSIVRQHTQKVLPDWLELMFTLGVIEKPATKKDFLDLATGVMDWLVNDVTKASKA